MNYDAGELAELSTEQLSKIKHTLIRSLPDTDHARNFTGWQELEIIDSILDQRKPGKLA